MTTDTRFHRFLAARLYMESLSTKMTVRALKNAIENLPSTLDQLYDDALRRIDASNEDNRSFAHRALCWVAYTYRPLTVHEFREALAIEPGDKDFDPDAQPEVDNVLEACVGMLIVDNKTQYVRLVHYTAQVYLDGFLTSRYRDAHASIAGGCITYLSFDVFQKSTSRRSYVTKDIMLLVRRLYRPSDKPIQYHLLDYASKFWAQHVTQGQAFALDAQVNGFLASNPRISLYAGPDRTSPREIAPSTGIGIAAYFGLNNALKHLLRDSVGIHEHSHLGFSALHLAAFNGEIAAIATLLDHGANIECKTPMEVTPLMVAILRGPMETAHVPLEKGANVNATDRGGSEVFAFVWWDSPIVWLQLLLDHRADINSWNAWRGTRLMQCAKNSDWKTVRWLLAEGAAVNFTDKRNRTALQIAIQEDSAEVVALLLENGEDQYILDDRGYNALHNACRKGNATIAKQIIESGIDIDAAAANGETALRMAVWSREKVSEMLDLFIETSASVDNQDDNGFTPLMRAVNRASASAIRILIDAGADVNLQDKRGCSALHLAAASGDALTIRELLRRHAMVNKRSDLALALDALPNGHKPQNVGSAEDLYLVGPGINVRVWSLQSLLRFKNTKEMSDMLRREEMQKFRVWKYGMTALDIAVARNDAECIDLLEPWTASRTEFTAVSFRGYMCELLGFSSVMELEEEMER